MSYRINDEESIHRHPRISYLSMRLK